MNMAKTLISIKDRKRKGGRTNPHLELQPQEKRIKTIPAFSNFEAVSFVLVCSFYQSSKMT